MTMIRSHWNGSKFRIGTVCKDINEALRQGGAVDILEIGGGWHTRIKVPGARYTVIDPDKASLDKNTYASETIHADAQNFNYGNRRFDAAIFWNVLEHIADPAAALVPALRSINPGGRVIIAGPNLSSFKALATKYTPHWAHVWAYRHLYGKPTAGLPGYAPFPTEHAGDASIDGLRATFLANGFEVEYIECYVSNDVRGVQKNHPILYGCFEAVRFAIRSTTFGRLGDKHSDFLLVARKLSLKQFEEQQAA